MKICKCLEVYSSSNYNYCPLCGQKTYDTISEEGQRLIKILNGD